MRYSRRSVFLALSLLPLCTWGPVQADQTGFEVVPAIRQSIHAETLPLPAGPHGSDASDRASGDGASTSGSDQPSNASLPELAEDTPVTQRASDPSTGEAESSQAAAHQASEHQSQQAIATTPPVVLKKADVYNVPIVIDSQVESHIRYFNTAIRDRFEKWLLRLSHYRPLVERIFLEFELPTDLVYLSLVESGFNPYAYSRARATGPWQFMKGTAQVYGLRVDSYVDERRDPIKSTVAAARYLRDLYDLFGTWPLAMAAYNAGEGKVMRALQKSQSESFVEISQTRFIRRETKEYVPRFMAATIIAKDPERYGFQLADVAPHDFDEVIVRRSIHLQSLAAASGVPFDVLKNLNPELRRYATPPGEAAYHLKVPLGAKSKVESILDRVPTWKATPEPRSFRSVKTKPPASTTRKWYRVRGGDTLVSIAKRFGLSVEALKHRNRISTRQLRAGELLAIR
jgi:membrane-bound lytic murein transglycosylase D